MMLWKCPLGVNNHRIERRQTTTASPRITDLFVSNVRLAGQSRRNMATARTEIVSHVWTAPCWQGFFLTLMRADRCCHVFGLLMRRCYMAAGHNALRRSGPSQKHAVKMLHWLKWGVLIFGSTGWVHYSSVALSNFVSARISRLSQTACDTGS